jgi:hypothetical protein
MDALWRYYREAWTVDFEFFQPPGEQPMPLCVAARELRSGRQVTHWFLDQALPPIPWETTADRLFITYYGSAELSCFLALHWPFPQRIVDLFVEFKCRTSGLAVPEGYSLLGALAAFGIPGMASATKEDMRALVQRGPPYSVTERDALMRYCQHDVDALGRLLVAMLPRLDLPRALLRGRYLGAVAQMEWHGIPLDVETLTELQGQWQPIQRELAQAVNRTHPVFVPRGQPALDPQTAFGAAVWRTATTYGVDPYQLAWAADVVWREHKDLATETVAALKQARFQTGLTPAAIARWEAAGHDSSSWPHLDDQAAELAQTLPALGLGLGASEGGGSDTTDYAGQLWALLRDTPARQPSRHDPAMLQRALTLVLADPEGLAWGEALTFSEQRFEQYLVVKDIPWPRLESGRLALDDDTFKTMANAYPAEISPIREVRQTLSQLKLHDLAVGHDGRNRCLLSVFGARTSRNTPSTSAYIFGPATWIRFLIKPHPGRALAYIDWSGQELGISAYLSGDQAMMTAYQSDDFYLWLAKEVGAAPPHATKATHAGIREQFKVLALGVMYGLTARGIARRLGLPLCDARLLLHHHHEVFRDFWRWSDLVEMEGMLGGTLRTVFGWRLHASAGVNPRTLRNFEAQANAAEMLRLACSLCVERGIMVDGPIHDALLVEGSLDSIDTVVRQTQTAMREASELVLPGFPLKSEATIIRYPERYEDPRGVQMWRMVQTILKKTSSDVPF